MKRLWLVAGMAWACGGPAPDGGAAGADSADPDSALLAQVDTVLPPMPDVPRGRAGHLVAVGVGELDSTWSWPFKAGRCARPAMIFMLPSELGQSGASILLELPEGDPSGPYPVRFADSTGVPVAPAAQLGLQFFEAQRSDAYQGADGAVSVERLTETQISGTFQVTVRHIVHDARSRLAGAFQDVPVEALPPDYCERLQSAQDSLRTGG
jgi:hypothetical protein